MQVAVQLPASHKKQEPLLLLLQSSLIMEEQRELSMNKAGWIQRFSYSQNKTKTRLDTDTKNIWYILFNSKEANRKKSREKLEIAKFTLKSIV